MQIYVTERAWNSSDKYDLIWSLIGYVDSLRRAYYRPEELPAEAMESYYVDYYLAEIRNGGISQFVYNSRWEPMLIGHLRSGLQKMNAQRHLALLDKVDAGVQALGDDLETYLEGDYFLDNEAMREALNHVEENFAQICEHEDLIALNYAFLRGLPNLKALPEDEYQAAMQALYEAVPDKEARINEAKENEPEEYKMIRRICEAAGMEWQGINAISYGTYNGATVYEWYISTSAGHHHVIFDADKALLFKGGTKELVAELSTA